MIYYAGICLILNIIKTDNNFKVLNYSEIEHFKKKIFEKVELIGENEKSEVFYSFILNGWIALTATSRVVILCINAEKIGGVKPNIPEKINAELTLTIIL